MSNGDKAELAKVGTSGAAHHLSNSRLESLPSTGARHCAEGGILSVILRYEIVTA
jgi:hypothetical protein